MNEAFNKWLRETHGVTPEVYRTLGASAQANYAAQFNDGANAPSTQTYNIAKSVNMAPVASNGLTGTTTSGYTATKAMTDADKVRLDAFNSGGGQAGLAQGYVVGENGGVDMSDPFNQNVAKGLADKSDGWGAKEWGVAAQGVNAAVGLANYFENRKLNKAKINAINENITASRDERLATEDYRNAYKK